jgi:assimilatory nitrate reductase catalytic subunit
VNYRYRGFAIGVVPSDLPKGVWWARVALKAGAGHLVAGDAELQAWRARANAAFAGFELAEYVDDAGGVYRAAAFSDGRLRGCVFVAPSNIPAHWDSVCALYAADALAPAQRQAVLTGRPVGSREDQGPQVCACFGVGRHAIEAAIANGARSPEAIGAALRAGTNCGSCLPEIRAALKGFADAATREGLGSSP